MSDLRRSNTLYPHPFSAAYWRDAAAELKDTRILVFAALMIALRVAMKLLAIPLAPGLKINTAFLANALGAMVFGPVTAALCAVVSDVLGYLQNPEGVYFLPFLFQEVAGSVIFALYLYRAKITPLRVMLSRFTICVFVNMVMQIPIMMWYYSLYMGGKTYTLAIALPGVIKNICMFPVESVVLTLLLSFMVPITNRMGLTHTGTDAARALRFTKKQVVTMVLLFAVSICILCSYLAYYYDTTNLITKSEGDERRVSNTTVAQCLTEPEFEGMTILTTVTSSSQRFLSSQMHYSAIVFRVDMDALEDYDIPGCTTAEEKLEYLQGVSKSPALKAAEAGALEQLGTVELTRDEKTGEVLSCRIDR